VAEPPAPEPVEPEPEPPVAEEPEGGEAEPEPRIAPPVIEPETLAEPRAAVPAVGPGKGKERKRVREVVNLREQEQLARQATSRLTRRPVTIDPRAMQSPRRRRRDKVAPAPAR